MLVEIAEEEFIYLKEKKLSIVDKYKYLRDLNDLLRSQEILARTSYTRMINR